MLVSWRSGAYDPGNQVGEPMVTVPGESATSKISNNASRIEFIRSCVAAVLFV